MLEPRPKQKSIAALYTRVSTDEQTLGTSLDAQRALASLAKPGLEVRLYDEGSFTGSHVDRPEYQRLVANITDGEVAQVIVAEQSRLMRDEFGEKWGGFARLCFISDVILTTSNGDTDFSNADDTMLASMRHILDARERESIVRRTARGKYDMMEMLPYVTARTLSYGYRLEPKIGPTGRSHQGFVVDPEQAEVVHDIFRRYLAGEGAPVIAGALNECNVPYYALKRITVSEKTIEKGERCRWTQAAVYHILKNELLTGLWTWGAKNQSRWTRDREPIIRTFPDLCIIDRPTFDAAQRMRERRSKQCPRTVNSRNGMPYAFSGVLKCAECGGTLVRSARSGERSVEALWRCKRSHDPTAIRSCTSRIRLHDDAAHALVWPLFREFAAKLWDQLTELANAPVRDEYQEKLEQQVAELDTRERNLLDIIETMGPTPILRERLEKLAVNRSRTQGEIARHVQVGGPDEEVIAILANARSLTADDFLAVPAIAQHAILSSLFSAIVIEPLPERGKRQQRFYRIKEVIHRSSGRHIPAEIISDPAVVFSSSPPRR